MERKYKDSGIEWIGKIPEAWDVCKIKNLCISIYSGGTPDSNNFHYWDGDIPWIPSGSCHDSIITEAPKSITTLGFENSSTKKIPANTTVMAMTGATCGNVGFVTFETCMNQSVTGYIVKKNNYSKFLFYCLLAAREDILTRKTGGAQSGINVEDCKSIMVPYIPNAEQKCITDYLDKKCGEIDSLIALQEQMIEKLKANKQSVITEAVTKGLDPNTNFVPSCIEWIGEIPEGWKVCRLKSVARIERGGSPRPIEEYLAEKGYNWIKIGDTIKGNKYISSVRQKIREEGLIKTRMVHVGDLILTNSMSFGEPYILKVDGCIHDGWVAISKIQNIDKVFLYYLLLSPLCQYQFKLQVAGGVVQNLNVDKIAATSIILPPLSEQQDIASYLDEKCADIDRLIALKQQKIESLKGYKKSVIYEAVTGKTII